MKTLEEKIAVMKAFNEGKNVAYYTAVGWVITKHPKWNWDDTDYKVVEEPSKKRMTNRQLAEWLARGNGQYTLGRDDPKTYFEYDIVLDDEEVDEGYIVAIRPWGSDEWVSPTVDIYERDCRGESK